MTLNERFDAVFCIYLEKRKEDWYHTGMNEWIKGRYNQAVEEFKKQNIQVEFIEGIDGDLLEFPVTKSSNDAMVSKGDMG